MVKPDKKWKDASGDEDQLHYIFFDVQGATASANLVLNYFSRAESAQNKRTTNMPLAGQLPPNQRFMLKKIYIMMDAEFNTATDESDVLDGGSLDLTINKRRMLHGPLRSFVGPIRRDGSHVTDVDATFTGREVMLDPYLTIPGGTEFNVEIITGDTAPTATNQLTVVMEGELVRPS